MAKLILVLIVALGLAYPLVMVLYGRVSSHAADGGLVYRDGRPVGAENIGQRFTSSGFFQNRPSAAGTGYNAMKSGASNLGPSNPTLMRDVEARVRLILRENPGITRKDIPVELVTSSASGLDPDISVDSALLQVPRVARATGISEAGLKQMISDHTRGRYLGFLGEPGVNVLALNLDVFAIMGRAAK